MATETNRPDYWKGYKAGYENKAPNPPALKHGYDGADWPVIEYNDGFYDGCNAREDEQDHPTYKNLPAAPSLDDYDADDDLDDSGQYLYASGYYAGSINLNDGYEANDW